jgi:hypothetical protein
VPIRMSAIARDSTLSPLVVHFRREEETQIRKLIAAQIEIFGQFNDYSYENPKLTFEEVVRKEFGPKLFPRTPQGRKFEMECREVFDRERKA